MIQPPEATDFLRSSFVWLALLLAVGFVWIGHIAGRRSGVPRHANGRLTGIAMTATSAWLAATWAAASSGVLAQFDRRPPPFALFFLAVLAVSASVAWSRLGLRLLRGLPLWALVATQVFRLPLELVMHEAAVEGVMPVQMSYSGRNFDILTGLTAIPVAVLIATGIGGRRLALAWNVLGTLTLANILGIALVSTPTFAMFGPERLNTWVAYPPFVWLPAVMVVSALIGHMVLWRKLLVTPTTTPRP